MTLLLYLSIKLIAVCEIRFNNMPHFTSDFIRLQNVNNNLYNIVKEHCCRLMTTRYIPDQECTCNPTAIPFCCLMLIFSHPLMLTPHVFNKGFHLVAMLSSFQPQRVKRIFRIIICIQIII